MTIPTIVDIATDSGTSVTIEIQILANLRDAGDLAISPDVGLSTSIYSTVNIQDRSLFVHGLFLQWVQSHIFYKRLAQFCYP